jgi:hypothetical protein
MTQQYLAPESEIMGVVLVDLEYPWPGRNSNIRRDLFPGKMVYFFYERPEIADNNIVPANIVSFGTLPLTEFDIQSIRDTTRCNNETIVGFRFDNLIACDAHNQYIQFIPGNCILRHSCHDVQLPAGEVVFNNVPHNFDLEVNLFRLQRAVLIGASYLPTNG